MSSLVTLRPLADADLPTLHRWLNEPGVIRWWEGDPVDWPSVVSQYGSARTEPGDHWIASAAVDGATIDIGWIQAWSVADYPEAATAWAQLDPPSALWGVDYLVGEPGLRGRGLGQAMIAAAIDLLFRRSQDLPEIWSDPALANTASWGALQAAGFEPVGVVAGEPDGPYQVMRITRSRWAES